jgi:hypothetical protein
MNVRLLTAGTLMLCAALLHAQQEPKTGTDEAGREAQRQGRVALQPNAQQSPTQTVQQAIAFERYKDLAAERQAAKDEGAATAESSRSQVRRTAANAKRK